MPVGWSTREQLVDLIMRHDVFMTNLADAGIMERSEPSRLVSLAFPQRSWRLSRPAWLAFLWTYEGYRLTNPENLFTPAMMLALGKHVKGPWYENNRTIYTWDSELNMQLAMFDGNLLAFSRFVAPK